MTVQDTGQSQSDEETEPAEGQEDEPILWYSNQPTSTDADPEPERVPLARKPGWLDAIMRGDRPDSDEDDEDDEDGDPSSTNVPTTLTNGGQGPAGAGEGSTPPPPAAQPGPGWIPPPPAYPPYAVATPPAPAGDGEDGTEESEQPEAEAEPEGSGGGWKARIGLGTNQGQTDAGKAPSKGGGDGKADGPSKSHAWSQSARERAWMLYRRRIGLRYLPAVGAVWYFDLTRYTEPFMNAAAVAPEGLTGSILAFAAAPLVWKAVNIEPVRKLIPFFDLVRAGLSLAAAGFSYAWGAIPLDWIAQWGADPHQVIPIAGGVAFATASWWFLDRRSILGRWFLPLACAARIPTVLFAATVLFSAI